jgi:hypothetical protein
MASLRLQSKLWSDQLGIGLQAVHHALLLGNGDWYDCTVHERDAVEQLQGYTKIPR